MYFTNNYFNDILNVRRDTKIKYKEAKYGNNCGKSASFAPNAAYP